MTRHTIKDIEGMVKRLNHTIIEHFAESDIRYSVEQTERNLYSINCVDISFKSLKDNERIEPIGQVKGILKTLTMNTEENIYWILYSMCNTIDNLKYQDGHY